MNVFENKVLQSTLRDFGGPRLAAKKSLHLIFDFARRRFWTVVYCVVFAAALGVLYFGNRPKNYSAGAPLTIDTRRFQLFPQATNLAAQLIDSTAPSESQLEVTKSENVALKAVKHLGLADDPEFGAAAPIPSVSYFLESRQPESESWRSRNALRTIQGNVKARRVGASHVISAYHEGNSTSSRRLPKNAAHSRDGALRSSSEQCFEGHRVSFVRFVGAHTPAERYGL